MCYQRKHYIYTHSLITTDWSLSTNFTQRCKPKSTPYSCQTHWPTTQIRQNRKWKTTPPTTKDYNPAATKSSRQSPFTKACHNLFKQNWLTIITQSHTATGLIELHSQARIFTCTK